MLKVAVVILIVMLAYAGIYSLMLIIVPEVALKSSLSARGKTVDEVRNDGYLGIIATSERLIGVFALATVISGFFILLAGFRKAQKWAWWAFLVVSNVAWVASLIINMAIGSTTDTILHIIGIVINLVGILLPIKVFFAKAVEEAPQEAQEV